MRLILTLVVASGLAAIWQGQTSAAAAGPPQSPQGATQSKCGTASPAASSGNPAEQPSNSACHPERLDWRLSQRGPGFWTAESAGPGSAGTATDPPAAVLHAADPPAPSNLSSCTSYPLMVAISGEPREAKIVACPQPDGSWQVNQYTPGLPEQSFTVPAPPGGGGASPSEFASPDYGQEWSWDWGGAPWFWGFAPAIVVGPGFNHFHTFAHGFRHGLGHGFREGFGHGFREGFGHGIAHGFAPGPAHGFAPTATPGFAHGFAHGFGHGVAAGHGGFGGMHR